MAKTKATSRKSKREYTLKPYVVDSTILSTWLGTGWSNSSNWSVQEDAEMYELEVCCDKGDIHPLLELAVDKPSMDKKDVKVTLTKNPYSQGEFRIAYLCKLATGTMWWDVDEKLVAKESRYTDSELNSTRQHYNEAHIQLVAGFLADEWTKIVVDAPIRYVVVKLLQSGENKNFGE